jgi:hypothetical protein
MSGTRTTWIGWRTSASIKPPTSQLPRCAVSSTTPWPSALPSTIRENPSTLSTKRADSAGGRVAKVRKSSHAAACPRTISCAAAATRGELSSSPVILARFDRIAARYLGRSRKYAPPTALPSG